MKRILCIILALTVVTLASCSGGEEASSAAPLESGATSYLPKEDSSVFKYFDENDFENGFVLNMKVERDTSTEDCVINTKGNLAHVVYTAYGTSRYYFTDGSKHYELKDDKKTAFLITGTLPDAIHLALSIVNTDYSLFIESGTKEVDSVSYKTETFAYKANSDDKVVYYIKDDNSIAFVEYLSSSSENYNVLITLNSMSNEIQEDLLKIPEDYTVSNV